MSALRSKTLSLADLREPGVRETAAELRRFARRLGVAGVPFAVNGILRRRFWVRPHKLWEYARGVSCVLTSQRDTESEDKGFTRRTQKETEGAEEGVRVLDFGGGATLPVFYLAHCGCDVLSLDTDPVLSYWTNRVAGHGVPAPRGAAMRTGSRWLLRERGEWKLRASPFDLTQSPAPEQWGQFDAVVSFSVLEHIGKAKQVELLARLAALVKPGGVMALTFDYGEEAPVEDAVRGADELERLVAATGLAYLDGTAFEDTSERFRLDRRHPQRRFTFASVFLRKAN